MARLGEWKPKRRKLNALQILADAERGRLKQLLPLKHERMAESAFVFFRGAAAVMAYDLSLGVDSGIANQICGDAHVQNLGAYAGIDGKLIFDVNDFDETAHAPFEWDVKRMATSILLAGAEAKVHDEACDGSADAFVHAYGETMRTLAGLPVLEVARYQVRRLNASAAVADMLQRAQRASPMHLLEKLTEQGKNARVFREKQPVLWRVAGGEREAVLASLEAYRESLLPERRHFFAQYRALDVAFKVVGTGSVGLRAYCIYMEGNGVTDPLFLQLKQEVESVYAPYLPSTKRMQEGRRVAEGQRAMQLQSDPLLGWTRMKGRDYLVRQLNDHKGSLDATTLTPDGLREYAAVCGEMLARGHARSGSAKRIVSFTGDARAFHEAMLRFAKSYAAQTVVDWKTLVARQAAQSKVGVQLLV